MPNVPSLTRALWATNLATPLNGLAGWTAHVDSKMAEAAAAGPKLLVMPEYACESWLAFKPEGLAPDEEIAWMARKEPAALELLRPLQAKHGVALLAGPMPCDHGARAAHPAWLQLPAGRALPPDQ